MGSELRLILLGLGAILIAALWVYEKRRSKIPSKESMMRSAERFVPNLDANDPVRAAPAKDGRREPSFEDPAPGIRAETRHGEDRPVPGNDPPIMMFDDLPANADQVVLVDSSGDARPGRSVDPEIPPLFVVGKDLDTLTEREFLTSQSSSSPVAPAPSTPVSAQTPTLTLTPSPVAVAAPPPATRGSEPTPLVRRGGESARRREPSARPPESKGQAVEPPKQRIVAMRLITPPDRPIEGAMLQLALDEEGLVFGRYSVFHRLAQDVPVFSVASLVEPGNFRPEDMPGRQYPGASLFAVFPGPQPAPLAFDDMVATARRLAERLDAVLQDETGSSLTSQRIKTIREELVQFEHLRALARSYPAG